jgi:hypothetical protein
LVHVVPAAVRSALEPAAWHLSVLAQQEASRSSQQQHTPQKRAAEVPRDSILAIGDLITEGNAGRSQITLRWEAVSAIARHSLTGQQLSQLYSVCKRTARGGHRGAGGRMAPCLHCWPAVLCNCSDVAPMLDLLYCFLQLPVPASIHCTHLHIILRGNTVVHFCCYHVLQHGR